MTKRSSLLNLRDKAPAPAPATSRADPKLNAKLAEAPAKAGMAPSRQGKKAMTGYFSPAMSLAMHTTARRHDMSLQDAMGEAMNDWLRKMGESPVGE